jgi:hypothetical protein
MCLRKKASVGFTKLTISYRARTPANALGPEINADFGREYSELIFHCPQDALAEHYRLRATSHGWVEVKPTKVH